MADEPQDKPPTGGTLSKLLAVQADLAKVRDRLGPLEDTVGGLVDTLNDLAARQKQAKPAPAWWPNMGDGERAERWTAFTTWLRDVLAARYPLDAEKLTVCWKQHPPVVDALTALWLTWQAAYLNPAADSRDAAQWMVTWRIQLMTLAEDDRGATRCRQKGAHVVAAALNPDLLGSFSPRDGDTP